MKNSPSRGIFFKRLLLTQGFSSGCHLGHRVSFRRAGHRGPSYGRRPYGHRANHDHLRHDACRVYGKATKMDTATNHLNMNSFSNFSFVPRDALPHSSI